MTSKKYLLLVGALLLSLMLSGEALAQDVPVEVSADQVDYLDSLNKIVARGNVLAIYKDMTLECDEAVVFMDTKDAYLTGRVRLIQPSGEMRGEEIVYNFETKKGTVLESWSEIEPFRTRGARTQKVAEDGYLHHHGYITTCDFEQPHTRVQGRRVQIYLDDRVVLKHVTLHLGNMPLMYLPSYTHKLGDNRTRVTLIPGKKSEWGFFLLSAWRVYLHENLQGRLHIDYREKRDLATGIDLKYRLPENFPIGGEGIFREYYTHERLLGRSHFYDKWISNDDKVTEERERYRVQLRHVWQWDPQTRATLEYNKVKDADFLRDFFEREFEDGTASPETYFQVIRTSPWYGLTFLVRKRVNSFETVTERLPSITLNVRPIQLPAWQRFFSNAFGPKDEASKASEINEGTNWYYESSYDFEHSKVADSTNGTEASLTVFDTKQTIFYTRRLWRWLNFRPFFTFQETMFSKGASQGAPQFRQSAATGFDLSTKLFRTFPLVGEYWGVKLEKLRHVITPSIQWRYQGEPTVSEEDLLRSDGLTKGNRVTFGMEHKLQTKRIYKESVQTLDLLRFTADVPYNLEGSNGRGGRWEDLQLDLEVLPYSWLRLESDAFFDFHSGNFDRINVDLIARSGLEQRSTGVQLSQNYNRLTNNSTKHPWAVGMGWRYLKNESTQLTFETEFDLDAKWRLGTFQAFDLKRFVSDGAATSKKINSFAETEFSIERDLHEWTVELVYNHRRSEGDTILLLFRLKAFPEMSLDLSQSYSQPKASRN